ncbi:glucosamine-6-phosphate deaminase [Streptococcus pseudoporcinus]|uniref:Glucosamine-6-phosphate deaminase n=2 Tax=Streptococcus pseudoporcinus TaxID=361101 RepID=G5K8W8_9STRE|nr:glucosamine-6-phosphate deaminase [Streptococcus pseudoporcinus]EFR43988.1 glucosamine-6-phosphate deaminase [Streptococcus pseudoporcinus SPIN 20026]EHI65118.1 glucosamine-6-phosphate deaminase [Streptococcus pseudoporcinus LQ 940-04]VEF93371.1 glucosamine-6-phosphate deaminase [Streptococcus pseudoporcinus]VTS12796.1 glucosamine-6-phosphate deaminase [Streptococcus pseudoporcinus]VUC65653.1 glucosamine-6-phosphate deaminase [Streptococcus pseudoporcinus]
MKVIHVKNQVEGGQVAFSLLKEAIANGAKTLGLATGSTPLAFYNEVVASDLDFSEMTSINLDEYVGLPKDHSQSYNYFMKEHLFNDKPFKESFLPNGLATNLAEETKAYDKIIANHPIDFQILGIGRNGHIGFNEPGTSFEMTTHVVNLEESTIEANSRFFETINDVPKQAISMGIASIMLSKTIVLMAFGKDKAEAIKKMVSGPVSEDLPASILQKHKDVVVIVDEEAASALVKS